MMAISWQPLDVGTSADAHLPPLLISKTFEANSYTIYLTDLTHIWVESLDHAGILRRAEEENTSIDPTDSSQLRILLNKLALALSSSPKTALNLHIDPHSGRARPAITLNLTIELPDGLVPLEWPMHLAEAPQPVLTRQLTIPLLQALQAQTREMEGLQEVLKDKDHVIQKLMDKLDVLGTDLGQVFPQAMAKGGRKVDRARAEEKVRGLAIFDLEVWRKDLGGDQAKDTAQLLQSVFMEGASLDLGAEVRVGGDNWWEKIKGSKVEISKGTAGATRNKIAPKPALKHQGSTQDNDDFQVQLTPPHLSKAPKASQSIGLDNSTDNESLNTSSQRSTQRSKIPDSFPSSQPAPTPASTDLPAKNFRKIGGKKETSKQPSPAADDSTGDEVISASKPTKILGNIGGKKVTPPPPEDNSTDDKEPPRQKSTKKFGKLGGKEEVAPKAPLPTEDDTTDDEEAPVVRNQNATKSPTPLPPASAPKSKKGKLGQIGGKKEPPPPPSSSPLPPVEAPKPKKGKLGQIGGRTKEARYTPPASDPAPQQEGTVLQTPPKRKLGTIGGKKNKGVHEENGAVEATEEETRGRPVKVEKEEEKTPPPRETSEERAEKKRRELKRQLEEKAKAPVKKKRKF